VIIVKGSRSPLLSQHLAAETGSEIASCEIRNFPDGEKYVRVITPLRGEDVLIVSATYPDTGIVETLLLKDAVQRWAPGRVRLLIPYYGYQRQDKLFREGEAVSAEVIARLLDDGFAEIMTVDLHAEGVARYFRRTKIVNFVASTEIAKHFRQRHIDVVISPDGGSRAVEFAKRAAAELDCEYDYFLKERIDSTTVRLYPKKMDVSGKHILVLDDIIATGSSMIAAVGRLKELGASEIYAGCTHGLFTDGALSKLRAISAEVVSTDTIETEASAVSVAPVVSEHIFHNHA